MWRLVRRGAWLTACSTSLACAPAAETPVRDCRLIVWSDSSASSLELVGSWDDWTKRRPMERRDDGWWVAALELEPGEYGYQVVERGAGQLDAFNPLTTFRESDSVEVSLAIVDDCAEPALVVDPPQVDGDALVIDATFEAARSEAALTGVVVESSIGSADWSVDGARVSATVRGLERGPHRVLLRAEDADGVPTRAEVRAWVDPVAATRHDEIVYHLMVDRFRGPDGVALDAPSHPGAWAGGSLTGVTAELRAGWFDALGVSTLWISPVYVNPEGERPGSDGNLYAAYHGYWVARSREVDDRFGGRAALEALVAEAHARGIKVVLDVVPNHVDETHALWADRTDDAWFNPLCECGTATCTWAEHQQDCWFTPYLPDLRMEHPDVIPWAAREVAWWVRTFDLDGVRVDAVPMMPRATTRRIVHELRADFGYTNPLTMGEVFTGPGGLGQLRYYLGPDGLDTVFDFPLMWALRAALTGRSVGFDDVAVGLDETDSALAGSDTAVARIIGNHDVTRMVSELAGDAGGDPWIDPPRQPGESAEDDAIYERHRLALSLAFTLPGMPVLYAGDELGLAGGADPDNRRVLPEVDGLADNRRAVLEHARRLGTLRRCAVALRGRDRTTVLADSDVLVFTRGGGGALVAISRDDLPRDVTLDPEALAPGAWVDALSGDTVTVAADGALELVMLPRSTRIFLPAGDPCAA